MGATVSKLKGQPVAVSSVLTTPNSLSIKYDSIEEAFPTVDAGFEPCGTVGLYQIRQVKRKTAGGIILADETVSTEHYNTQVAKVVALGPLCFKSTATFRDGTADPQSYLVEWPEGAWFKIGDYVRVPRYGGDRFTVPFSYEGKEYDPEAGRDVPITVREEAVFALFKVKDVLGKITGDPLAVKAFLD